MKKQREYTIYIRKYGYNVIKTDCGYSYQNNDTVCTDLQQFINLQTIYNYKQCLVQSMNLSFYVGETISGETFTDVYDALNPFLTYGEKIKDVSIKPKQTFPGYEVIKNTDTTFKVNTYGWRNNGNSTISCTGYCYTIGIINVTLEGVEKEFHFYIFDDHTSNILNPYMASLSANTSDITYNNTVYKNYKESLKHCDGSTNYDEVSSAFTTTLTNSDYNFSETTIEIQGNRAIVPPSGTKKLICVYENVTYYWKPALEVDKNITSLSIDIYTGIVPNNTTTQISLEYFLGGNGRHLRHYDFE